ncbi:MAG: zf-HC2 domain-containing protein [Thermoleophilia bacterium]
MADLSESRAARCSRAREWVSLREDGELSELEKLLLRRHLGRCPDCRAFADAVGAVTSLLRASEAASPARSVVPARLGRAPRFGWRARLGVVVVAGAAGLGALVGWITASSQDGPAPIRPPVTTIAVLPDDAPPPAPDTEPAPRPPSERPSEPV